MTPPAESIMKTNAFIAGLLGALALGCAIPAVAGLSREDAMEAMSSDLVLPASAPGGALARSCASCPTRSLQLTSASQYFAGTQPITLAELRRRFATGRFPVLVAVQPDTSIVSRIVITGDAYSR
jgi:hypothetical protein